MPRVLIIEDESVLRSSVARGIARLGVEVDDAPTLNDGLKLIDQTPPDVVISDIDMPERSGLELLGELGRRGLNLPVIFVSGYLNAYRSQIPHHASVEVLEKPVPIEELREVVKRRLGEATVQDEVSPFGVPDYLQLACMGRHSVLIEVEREGKLVGEVVISAGDIWSAKDGDGHGLEALSRLTFSEGALVRCRRLADPPHAREFEGGWEYLLMEAARVSDESKRSQELDIREQTASGEHPTSSTTETIPGEHQASSAKPPAPEPESDPQFSQLWDDGLEAMLGKDFPRALSAFERALQLKPDDARLLANIERLHQMGYESMSPEPEPERREAS